jgi:hypothetical protein
MLNKKICTGRRFFALYSGKPAPPGVNPGIPGTRTVRKRTTMIQQAAAVRHGIALTKFLTAL